MSRTINEGRGIKASETAIATVATVRATPEAAAATIVRRTKMRATLGVLLGSGFQSVLSRCTVVMETPYSEIPGFISPGVDGHEGRMVLGYLDKTPVVILSGRLHYYEGYSMDTITFPIRTLAAMGIKALVLTNAAGGINSSYRQGDFMLITDQINMMGASPLRGAEVPGRKRFVDLTDTYNRSLLRLMKAAAKEAGARSHDGVYMAVSGPNFETPAEIKAFATLGADAVGMSTAPEAIVARQCDIKVAGVSCITNRAAGLAGKPLSHAETLDAAQKAGPQAAQLLEHFARLYAQK
jgi:inosine/guanosine/xanthosine phosphorylase family protein